MTITKQLYKSMPDTQIFSILNRGEYEFLYEKLNNKKTYSYIDENQKNNLVAVCNNNDLMIILKAKKSIYVDKHSLGILFQIKFIEYGFSFEFIFDVFNEHHLEILNNMVSSNEDLIISFVVKQVGSIHKAFHFNFSIEDKLKQRIGYIRDSTYNLQYPRIIREEYINPNASYFEFEFEPEIIKDLIDVCDKLSKWKSLDVFHISLVYNENLIVIINGLCKNLSFIRSELIRGHNLIAEGEIKSCGVPLLKYDKGNLYFFEYK